MRTVFLMLAVVLSMMCIGWAGSAFANPSPPNPAPASSAGLKVDPLLGGDLYTKPIPVATCGDASAQCTGQPDGTPCGVPALGCVCMTFLGHVYRCTAQ